jgi:hypothetical protein
MYRRGLANYLRPSSSAGTGGHLVGLSAKHHFAIMCGASFGADQREASGAADRRDQNLPFPPLSKSLGIAGGLRQAERSETAAALQRLKWELERAEESKKQTAD